MASGTVFCPVLPGCERCGGPDGCGPTPAPGGRSGQGAPLGTMGVTGRQEVWFSCPWEGIALFVPSAGSRGATTRRQRLLQCPAGADRDRRARAAAGSQCCCRDRRALPAQAGRAGTRSTRDMDSPGWNGHHPDLSLCQGQGQLLLSRAARSPRVQPGPGHPPGQPRLLWVWGCCWSQ